MSVRLGGPTPPPVGHRPGPVRSAWLLLATVLCVVLLPSRAWSAEPTPSPTDSGATAPATVGTGPTDSPSATSTGDPTPSGTGTPTPTDSGTPTPTGGTTATAAGAVVALDGDQFTALMVAAGLLLASTAALLVVNLRAGS